ncbi:MAG TPA: hypothetical protein VIU62_04130 [Chloroflexota bacterium]
MNKEGEARGRDDWARRAAARAAARGGYMAGLLAAYQEMQRMDERQLAAELGCAPERLPLLGLCQEPRRQQTQFAADVREIAGYAGANVGQLARLIRTVDSTRALSKRSANADAGYLAAARDAADPPVEHEPHAETGDDAEQETGPDGNLA